MDKSRSCKPNPNRRRCRRSYDPLDSGYTVDIEDLLFTTCRHFLIRNNGKKVGVDHLKGKMIVLYIAAINIPRPPRMEVIKEAYRDARSRGYNFEIVQINYHYQILNERWYDDDQTVDYSERQRYENIDWLMLPFKDPSCRKLQRIFKCKYDVDSTKWIRDCLVIIDDSRDDKILFEFCGAEIIEEYGIEAYPFTRQALYEVEYARLKKEVKLQLLFPPGLCQFLRPAAAAAAGGFDLVGDSQLKGKRVLVLFGDRYINNIHVILLGSEYRKRAKGDKFEIVYVDRCKTDFFQDMPWLVHPYSEKLTTLCTTKIFKSNVLYGFAAFDIDGELIFRGIFKQAPDRLEPEFPFLKGDLRGSIRKDLRRFCHLDDYYDHP